MDGDSTLPVTPPESVAETVEALAEHAPFVEGVKEGFHPVDLLALSTVPVVLLAVFSLSLETRRSLAFDYASPTLATAFTSHFVHLDTAHLVGNLVGYVVLASLVYLLALSTGNRQRVYLCVGTFLLAFPFPLSYLNLAFPLPGRYVGFSGVLMAIFGYALVEFARYLGEFFTEQFDVEQAPAFFFGATAFVAVPHAEMARGFLVLGVSLVAAVAYSLAFLTTVRPSLAAIGTALDRQGYFELALVAGLFTVVFVRISFPANPIIEAGIVNIYSHLVGLCMGFLTAYVWVLVTTPAEPTDAIPLEV